jgi:hypothetical protein
MEGLMQMFGGVAFMICTWALFSPKTFGRWIAQIREGYEQEMWGDDGRENDHADQSNAKGARPGYE